MALSIIFLAAAAPFATQEVSFDPASEAALPIDSAWRKYSPDWVVQFPEKLKEDAAIGNGQVVELFQIRPKEAFRLEESASEAGSKKILIPAGTILVRAPGPLNAACEMLRQPGFERRTCLIDSDLDGRFDALFRRIDTSPLLMVPAQSPKIYRKLTVKQLEGHPTYKPLDEKAEMPPIRFIIRLNRKEKKTPGDSENYASVCVAPYATDLPQGIEYFGRDCLNAGTFSKDKDLPASIRAFGSSAVLTSADGGQVRITITRPPTEFQTKLLYEAE